MANDPVPANSPGAKIIADEEALYAKIQTRVTSGEGEEPARPGIDVSDVDRDLLSLRDQISEARGEDLPPLIEQMTRLAALRGRLGAGKDLPIDLTSPYFAHLRLKVGGKSRDVMVGKRGFIDRTSNVQIVDWRNAPVSRVYYRYEEGDEYEEEIADKTVEGKVEVRRNVSIFKSNLRRIGAPQGTFIKDARGKWVEAVGTMVPVLHGGSGKAARPAPVDKSVGKPGRLGVHGGGPIRVDKALPEIAALIDKEQFELITQPDSGIVVIQGGAGSGKTTVALHRVAFLNFNDERRFKASNCLFVVPTQSLVRYVGGVLPALGVSGVPVMTYTSWARTQRMKLLPESPIKYNEDPPDQVSRVKKHPAMIRMLNQWVAQQAAQFAVELSDLPELTRPVADAGIAEWERLRKRALLPRLVGMGSWLKKSAIEGAGRLSLEGLLRRWRKRGDDIGADWSELLTDERVLREGFEGTDVTARDISATIDWVRRQIAPPPRPPVDDDGKLLETADGAPVHDESDPAGKLDDEDDPILLRLIQLKRGGLLLPGGPETLYEHVAVDEAQDRSALEIKVLIESVVAPDGNVDKRSVTIAGDVAQRLVFDNNFTGWTDLLAQTGQPAIVRPLKLSYRSTAEVMLLAREVLGPELAPDEPLAARPGEPVELHEFTDVGDAVGFLSEALRGLIAREPTASCCVVSRFPEQADAYYEGLRRAEVPTVRRIRRDEFSFQPGIDVTDVSQVKGLEFDYVVMVDCNESSYPNANFARHLMHIGVTRAAHQLWMLSTSEPSPLIPKVLRDGGRMTVG